MVAATAFACAYQQLAPLIDPFRAAAADGHNPTTMKPSSTQVSFSRFCNIRRDGKGERGMKSRAGRPCHLCKLGIDRDKRNGGRGRRKKDNRGGTYVPGVLGAAGAPLSERYRGCDQDGIGGSRNPILDLGTACGRGILDWKCAFVHSKIQNPPSKMAKCDRPVPSVEGR